MGWIGVLGRCGCFRIRFAETDIPSFITEDSNYDPDSTGYKPFVTEFDQDKFFVPETYDEMSEPIKFSEVGDAPELNAMSYFVGIQDNGDGSFTNYNFTPAVMMAYIIGQTRKTVVSTNADTVTDAFITGGISAINVGGQLYNAPFFTVVGNTITPNAGLMSWGAGDTLTLFK